MTNEHQKYTINGNKVFSLIAEEDYREETKINLSRRRPGLYPSSASVQYKDSDGIRTTIGECLRSAWYNALQIEQTSPATVGLKMKGNLGKWAEIGTVNKWKEMGIWVANNIKFYNPKYSLSGELDFVIKNLLTQGLIGVEMKSFYGHYAGTQICGLKGRKKDRSDKTPGMPKENQFLQASIYAWEYKDELESYRIYYLERGDGHRVEFGVGSIENKDGTHSCYWEQIPGPHWGGFNPGKVIQPYAIEDIYWRYEQLLKYAKERKLPPKDYTSKYDTETIERKFGNGQISKTNYKKWQTNKNIKLGDWQCIGEDTFVSTLQGWKKIKEIKAEKDKVLTRDGFKIVKKVWEVKQNTDTVLVKPFILDDYCATPDHKILIAQTDSYNKGWRNELANNIEFRRIQDIDISKRNYLIYEIDRTIQNINITTEQLTLIGNFITEGNYHKNEDNKVYKCGFTFGTHDSEHAENIGKLALNYGATSYRTKLYEDLRGEKPRHSIQLKVYGIKFIKFINKYVKGYYSYNKSFSEEIIKMHPFLQFFLLNEINKQDGSYIKMRNSLCWNYSTTSKALALQVQQMLFRQNKIGSLVQQKSKGQKCFENSIRKDLYHVRWFPEAKRSFGFIKDNKVFAKLNKIKSDESMNVWDMSIDGQHEFLTQGGIVHNCAYCFYKDRCKKDELTS